MHLERLIKINTNPEEPSEPHDLAATPPTGGRFEIDGVSYQNFLRALSAID